MLTWATHVPRHLGPFSYLLIPPACVDNIDANWAALIRCFDVIKVCFSFPWMNAMKCLFLGGLLAPGRPVSASFRKHAACLDHGPHTELLRQHFYNLGSSPMQTQIRGFSNPHSDFRGKEILSALILFPRVQQWTCLKPYVVSGHATYLHPGVWSSPQG